MRGNKHPGPRWSIREGGSRKETVLGENKTRASEVLSRQILSEAEASTPGQSWRAWGRKAVWCHRLSYRIKTFWSRFIGHFSVTVNPPSFLFLFFVFWLNPGWPGCSLTLTQMVPTKLPGIWASAPDWATFGVRAAISWPLLLHEYGSKQYKENVGKSPLVTTCYNIICHNYKML